jgi:hypothetical protein
MTKVISSFEGMRVVAHGGAEGVSSATAFASQKCSFVNFVADEGNTGLVAIGNSASVTLPANSTTTTAGFQLTAKGQTGFLPCRNLDNFFYICSSTVDFVNYICIG